MAKKAPSIRLLQYRPSFSIQLFLRLNSTPHLIFNSSTNSTESNGPLPNLLDLNNKVSVGIQTPTTHLVNSRLDGIFTYLIEKRMNEMKQRGRENISVNSSYQEEDDGDDDIIKMSDAQKADRKAIMSQLNELGIVLKSLRYGHDIIWDGIYKGQCIKAHLYPNGDSNEVIAIGAQSYYDKRGWSFLTWFQIWAERIVARKEVESDSIGKTLIQEKDGLGNKQVNVNKALAMAAEVYSSLDWKIGQSSYGNLLDTEELSLVDILLFGHLADALCDIHLVTTLVEYKYLITFFQNTYETYFGKKYHISYAAEGRDTTWIKWNDRVNALNQFNRIPMNDVERKIRDTLDSGGYQDAIKIMQSVALHCHDLREVLADVALLREKEEKLYGSDSVPRSLVGQWLHKVRMGGELKVDLEEAEEEKAKQRDEDDDMTKKNEKLMKKVLREAKRNDELWITGTIVATLLGIFASSMSGAN